MLLVYSDDQNSLCGAATLVQDTQQADKWTIPDRGARRQVSSEEGSTEKVEGSAEEQTIQDGCPCTKPIGANAKIGAR